MTAASSWLIAVAVFPFLFQYTTSNTPHHSAHLSYPIGAIHAVPSTHALERVARTHST